MLVLLCIVAILVFVYAIDVPRIFKTYQRIIASQQFRSTEISHKAFRKEIGSMSDASNVSSVESDNDGIGRIVDKGTESDEDVIIRQEEGCCQCYITSNVYASREYVNSNTSGCQILADVGVISIPSS